MCMSCRYDNLALQEEELNDKKLFALTGQASIPYIRHQQLVPGKSPSHSGNIQVLFNAKAQSVLGQDGKLPLGAAFPDSALVIKKIYNSSTTTPDVIAVMYRTSRDPLNSGGWVWAEFKANGDAIYSIDKKGEGCVSCHSQTGNRDLVRTFELHP